MNSGVRFFNGLHPYTGDPLQRGNGGNNGLGRLASCYGQEASPSPVLPQESLAAPTTNAEEVLDPLYQAQQCLSKARSSMSQVSTYFDRLEREATSGRSSVTRAQSDLYPAESDTEETDNSGTGRWAAGNLSEVERSLQRLNYDSSVPRSAIWEIKQQVDLAQGHINDVNSARLPYPWRLQQVQQNISDFQSRLYRIEQAQQQLEWKVSSSQSPLQSAQYQIGVVANDQPGQCVADAARNARYHLNDLASQLQSIEAQLRSGNADVSAAESALAQAEQNTQACHSEFSTHWYMSDKKA